MITLYHARMSRSTRVLWLLEELGAPYEIVPVEIARPDGSGGGDPANPHPLKQVPCLRDGEALIVESLAIWLHLSDAFPDAGMAPAPGDSARADYVGWLGLSTAVFEPLVTAAMSGNALSERQAEAQAYFDARFAEALARGPWLMGERFSTVDLVYASLLRFFPSALTPTEAISRWLERIAARPALARVRAIEGVG